MRISELISGHSLGHELPPTVASCARSGACVARSAAGRRACGLQRSNYGSERHDCEAAAWPPVAALRVARAQGRVPRELPPTKTSATNVGPSMHDRSSGLAALLVVIVYQTFGGEGGGMS